MVSVFLYWRKILYVIVLMHEKKHICLCSIFFFLDGDIWERTSDLLVKKNQIEKTYRRLRSSSFFLLSFFVEGNSCMWFTKDIYLSTAIERKNPVRYNFYLFIYVKINLWDNMCDHSLIGKHIVAWRSSPFFIVFFIYWRKLLYVIILMYEIWERTSVIILIR